MKKIDIDFSRRTLLRGLYRTNWTMWALGALGVIVCIAIAIRAWVQHQDLQMLEEEIRRLRIQLAQKAAKRPATIKWTIPNEQASAVNEAIAQLNLPWRDVLDAIEAATPSSIAVLSLEPDAKKHQLKGVAEAKTNDAMLLYVEQLKKQTYFSDVMLIRHEINEQDTNKPIRFQFEMRWKGAFQ